MTPAPAYYIGTQSGFADIPAFSLYNLTADIPGHPAGSTVSDITLRELGYSLPELSPEYASPDTN